jgi:two-component system, OmpR family, response regulator ResD
MAGRVLVVDDDVTVAEVVVGYLTRAGYEVEHAADGDAALRLATPTLPDLVVLDLMLPGIDGLEVCRRLRAVGPVPVIMLTALGEASDRIMGLEVGADDYVTKPFSPRELVLRAESVLRRGAAGWSGSSTPAAGPPSGGLVTPGEAPGEPRRLRAGPVEVDRAAHRAYRDGVEMALTMREYDLLVFLLGHQGQAFTREELLHRVWGWSYGDHSTVTVHVRRLREKVEVDPADPRLIRTVWGVGYLLEPGTS